LAAYCLQHNIPPREVYDNKEELRNFQDLLVKMDIPLEWPEVKPL